MLDFLRFLCIEIYGSALKGGARTIFVLVLSWHLVACGARGQVAVEERTTIATPAVTVSQASRETRGRTQQSSQSRRVRVTGSEEHVVNAGETLYSIAFMYRLSVDNLMRWNNISDARRLGIGQRLRLTPAQLDNFTTQRESARAQGDRTLIQSNKSRNDAKANKQTSSVIDWQWPLKGEVIERYSPRDRRQATVIAVANKTPIKPVANGTVVYTGNALKGYGNMIIINHANNYLSAYAHTSDVLVSEGQSVSVNDVIARSGVDQMRRKALHLQVRLHGEPIDPMKVLPK